MTAGGDVTRVLFIGNSFTFRNELPAQFEHIAASLGRKVEWSISAIGGCTLYGQTQLRNARTAQLMTEDWDFIVLQDYSALSAFSTTREKYFYPAIREVVGAKKQAKVVLYMTWGYAHGVQSACQIHEASFEKKLEGCWPTGDLAMSLEAECQHDSNSDTLASFPCMSYALAHAHTSALSLTGADLVSPAGLAWLVVKGVNSIPSDCKAAIDKQFPDAMGMALPPVLNVTDFPPLDLNIWDLDGWNKHASIVGQYLNALTMYATIFGESPVGAAPPVCSKLCFLTNFTHMGPGPLTPPLDNTTVLKLQEAAAGVVDYCGDDCRRRPSWIA